MLHRNPIYKLYRSVTRDLTVFILHSLYYIPNNFLIYLDLIHEYNITIIAVILHIYISNNSNITAIIIISIE